MPTDRILVINISLTVDQSADGLNYGNYGGGRTTYRCMSATPSAPSNIIDSNGNIDLGVWTGWDHSQFNENVDITFTLDANATINLANGAGQTTLPMYFATKYGPAVTISGPNLSMMTWSLRATNQLEIDDSDSDSNQYTYCPAIELQIPGRDVYYIQLDPMIKNRPT